MKILSKTTLAATAAVALLAACGGGSSSIDGTYVYDTAEQSRAAAVSFVEAGSFCNRSTVTNISTESILRGDGQAAITYQCVAN